MLTCISETLEKFQFPVFKKPRNKSIRRSHFDARMNYITPLGISRGHALTSKSKRVEGKAFEDQVREGGFRIDLAPEYNYDDHNNRLVSVKVKESSQSDINGRSDDSVRPSQLSGIKVESSDEADGANIWTNIASKAADNERRRPLRSSTQRSGKILLKLRRKGVKTLSARQTLQVSANTDSTITKSAILDSNESYCTSVDSISPCDHHKASLETNKTLSPDLDAYDKENKAFPSRNVRRLVVADNTLRDHMSSDADDEQEPASDLESHASVNDDGMDEEDGPSLNKDDKGLHKELKELLKLKKSKGKRTRAAEGEVEEGEDGGRHYNTEEDQALSDDAGQKMDGDLNDATVSLSKAVNILEKPKTKRVKVASGSY